MRLSGSCCEDASALLVVSGLVNGRTARLLIDSGATNSFVSERFVKLHDFQTDRIETKKIRLANGQVITADQRLTAGKEIPGRKKRMDLIVIQLGYDAILGVDWLAVANPSIDFSKKEISFNSKDQSDLKECTIPSSSPPSSSSSSLSTVHQSSSPPTAQPTGPSSVISNSLELSSTELIKQINPLYLNKKVAAGITDENTLLEVNVFDGSRSKAVNYLGDHLNAISCEEAMKSISGEVKPLVSEYRGLFADKLPAGLPPKRVVNHQIDLLPETRPFN